MKMTMGKKVFGLFMAGGLLPFITIGIISYDKASTSLMDQAMNQSASVREMKSAAIEQYEENRTVDVQTLAASPMMLDALVTFKTTFKDMGPERARSLYISDNPYPAGQKLELVDARDDSLYTMFHAKYHPYLKYYLERHHSYYHDIFLVDSETGDVVYTVYKEDDYGTNLYNGRYRDTSLAEAARAVNASAGNTVEWTDYRTYAPSKGIPARFAACPILDDEGKKAGILILQLSTEAIDAIMAERKGLGEAEALAAATVLRNRMIITGIGLTLGVAALGYLVLRISGRLTGLLRGLVQGLSEGSANISAASQQIHASSLSLSKGATEQAASVEETSASMEEMSAMTRQNADHAVEAAQFASMCNKSAEEGTLAMFEMNNAMNEIDKSGKKIGDIISAIDGIAFQTNILALNAAIEAARSGEQGKGFAVVAEEVRNLAQRSAVAAKDTTSLIQESLNKNDTGIELARKCTASFEHIAANITKMTNLADEISAASQEQSQGVEQVSRAIQQIDQTLQDNAATAEESASAGEELSSQSHTLNDLVTRIVRGIGGGAGGRVKDEKPSQETPITPTKRRSRKKRRTGPSTKPGGGVDKLAGCNRMHQELLFPNRSMPKGRRALFYESVQGKANGNNGGNGHNGNGKKGRLTTRNLHNFFDTKY